MPRRGIGAGPPPVRSASRTGREGVGVAARRAAARLTVAASGSAGATPVEDGRLRLCRVGPHQRATTTVAWACVATCSDTLPWSALATARARGSRRRSCRSRARRRCARWSSRDVAAGLHELGLDAGLAQQPPRLEELLGVDRAVVPRVDAGAAGADRHDADDPDRGLETLGQLDRLLERPPGGLAAVVGEQDLLHRSDSFRATAPAPARATGAGQSTSREHPPRGVPRPAAGGPGARGRRTRFGHGTMRGDRPGGALRPDRGGLRRVVVARPPARDAPAARRDRGRPWPRARAAAGRRVRAPGRWPRPRPRAGPGVGSTGIDASAGMLAIAERSWRRCRAATRARRARFAPGAGRRLPFADGTFDVALSAFVLQLVPSRYRALREARRVLRPGRPAGGRDLDARRRAVPGG